MFRKRVQTLRSLDGAHGDMDSTLPTLVVIETNNGQPVGQRRLGPPKDRRERKLSCRYQGFVHWEETAQNYKLWKQHLNKCLDFCRQYACSACTIKFRACALKGLAARHPGLTDWLLATLQMRKVQLGGPPKISEILMEK